MAAPTDDLAPDHDANHQDHNEVMVAVPEVGRRFTGRRRVGLGDVTPFRRLRLDAVAQYLQDIATADYEDAGLPGTFAFVLRRVLVEAPVFPVLGERLTLTTFCGGLGQRWAERRTHITGDHGALVDCAALWVSIDAAGRPVRLPSGFVDHYGEAALGRTVSARLTLGRPSDRFVTMAWALRFADLDTLGHVNNAAHWQAGEELVAGRVPVRARIEYQSALTLPGPAELLSVTAADGMDVCAWLSMDGRVHSSMAIRLQAAAFNNV